MKIRNGFVSNSSSSSFIIALPKEVNIEKSCAEFAKEFVTEFLEDENLSESEIDAEVVYILDAVKYIQLHFESWLEENEIFEKSEHDDVIIEGIARILGAMDVIIADDVSGSSDEFRVFNILAPDRYDATIGIFKQLNLIKDE